MRTVKVRTDKVIAPLSEFEALAIVNEVFGQKGATPAHRQSLVRGAEKIKNALTHFQAEKK